MTDRPYRIDIVGCATSSIEQASWKNLEVDVWGLTSLHHHFPEASPRINLWFELHKNYKELHKPWYDWALEKQPPVMMIEKQPELTRSMEYPLDDAVTLFGRYFTSTVAYMMALAIMRRPEKIGLFGIDMMLGTEYEYQRPCCEYLIGVARGYGIETIVPKESALLKSDGGLYGYEHTVKRDDENAPQSKLAIWRAKAIHYERQAQELQARLNEKQRHKQMRKRAKSKRRRPRPR
jgi:hypothetical protein